MRRTFSGEFKLEAVKLVVERGVTVAQGSPLLGENAAARIAQLNIMDALFVAVAQRDLATAEANLARTRRAVETKRSR